MNDSIQRVKEEATVSGRTPHPPSVGAKDLLHVITSLNLIRMNLGMYPPGHTRITESIEHTFDMIQGILREKDELYIGFAGDTLSFGETATGRESKNSAFQDYARCLNHLRIVSFTLHRGLKKEELREFNRILSAKPADIWAMGKIETVFERAGIRGIKATVIDADHFRMGQKKDTHQARVDTNVTDEQFWERFFTRLKAEASIQGQSVGIPADQRKLDPADAIRFINQQRRHWPSAVLSYEKMVHGYFSGIQTGMPVGAEALEALTDVNALVTGLHPDLKKQLIDVAERQLSVLPNASLTEENLTCFSQDIFVEILGQMNESGALISPALVGLLQKMSLLQEAPASNDRAKEKDFSSEVMQTLLRRENHEKYVPEDYDRLLKKAAGTQFTDEKGDESPSPSREDLQTLTHEQVDFRICRLIHSIMDQPIAEEEYASCSRKLSRCIPDLLRGAQFSFLASLIDTLRRHVRDKPTEPIRQKALSLLRSLSDKDAIAKHVTPFILRGTEKPDELKTLLIASGVQHLSWLFDLYLDAKAPVSTTITEILKGFGRNTTEEILKRLPGRDSRTIVRLITLIRAMAERPAAASLKTLMQHKEWTVRREVIKALIEFDDPAVLGLLRKSLNAENPEEVREAVSIACRYRVKGVLADLTSMLKTVFISNEGVLLNEWLVGELANTKNPSVIPHLERIAATWFSFSPKHLTRTKVALYRNIGHFPKKQILKLLQKGYRSRNKEIRMACVKILKNKE